MAAQNCRKAQSYHGRGHYSPTRNYHPVDGQAPLIPINRGLENWRRRGDTKEETTNTDATGSDQSSPVSQVEFPKEEPSTQKFGNIQQSNELQPLKPGKAMAKATEVSTASERERSRSNPLPKGKHYNMSLRNYRPVPGQEPLMSQPRDDNNWRVPAAKASTGDETNQAQSPQESSNTESSQENESIDNKPLEGRQRLGVRNTINIKMDSWRTTPKSELYAGRSWPAPPPASALPIPSFYLSNKTANNKRPDDTPLIPNSQTSSSVPELVSVDTIPDESTSSDNSNIELLVAEAKQALQDILDALDDAIEWEESREEIFHWMEGVDEKELLEENLINVLNLGDCEGVC